ncbi:MAG TPA: restriction endonuclease subunit S [Vicinamibacterales bacterium]|nr:restriction endonuclease subunit S [Vicinamibacterales bacterium]
MSFPRYLEYTMRSEDWLREVPSHWDVRRLQRCVAVTEGQVDPEDLKYSAMPLLAPNHIEPGTGRLLGLESAADQAAESGKYLCRSGDVVYSKIRPALRKAAIAPEDCLCSADMYPLRAHSGLTNAFLFWWLLSEQFSGVAVLESQRVAMPKINRESLKQLSIPLPTLGEQTAIERFLSFETAKIDALVGEQRRLIDLLKEKRQAAISHAVTKGLNPDAPMNPSNIEWLGDVPEHWRVTRIKYRASVSNGSTPSRERPDYWTAGTFPWLNSGVVNDDPVASAEQFVTALALKECHLPIVRPPAIVVGITGQGRTRGMASALLFEATVSQHLAVLKPIDGMMDVYFLKRVIEMAYSYLRRDSDAAGSTKGAITCEELGNFSIPCPPMGEQRAISAYTDQVVAEIDSLIAETDRAIDLLQERRTALISAAVTGQIDVRGLVPSEAAGAGTAQWPN